jgi:hypothetical protein
VKVGSGFAWAKPSQVGRDPDFFCPLANGTHQRFDAATV